jgi:hypothetical protein
MLNVMYTVRGYYTACGGNSLSVFWENLLVPSSRVKKSMKWLSSWIYCWFKRGLICCHETLVRNYCNTLCNNPGEHRSHYLPTSWWKPEIMRMQKAFIFIVNVSGCPDCVWMHVIKQQLMQHHNIH